MKKLTYKRWQAFLALFSLLMLVASFYFEYYEGLKPCPLCLMQRFSLFLLLLICYLAVYGASLTRARILAVLQGGVAMGGLFFAGRQLWLQSLPSGQAPSCMPDLDVLIRYFPWKDVLHALVWGAGDCAEVTWEWLGLSMPAWSALYFLFMLIAAVATLWKISRPQLSTSSGK